MKPRGRRGGAAQWIGGGLAAAAILHAGAAAADEKQRCAAAYDQTQSLRDAGKLSDARKTALTCSASVCPGFIVKDCAAWLAQIDASMPTIVVEVHDAAGAETSAVQVDLDGKPWLTELDGKAKTIDPGPHVLRVTIAGTEPREQRIQIKEAEKARRISITFQVTAPTLVLPPAEAVPARAGSPAGAWVLLGVGLAGLVAGAVMGGIVVHDHSIDQDPTQCSPTAMKCTANGLAAQNQGKALGPATTAALVIGGAGVVAGAVWLGVRRRSDSTSAPAAALRLGVGIVGGGPAFGLRGSF